MMNLSSRLRPLLAWRHLGSFFSLGIRGKAGKMFVIARPSISYTFDNHKKVDRGIQRKKDSLYIAFFEAPHENGTFALNKQRCAIGNIQPNI